MKLKDLGRGNVVYCAGNSGFCHNSTEVIQKVSFKFDEDTGERYKVIHLSGERLFDSRTGRAITPPTAYTISVPKT
jgi:hypothetical protein